MSWLPKSKKQQDRERDNATRARLLAEVYPELRTVVRWPCRCDVGPGDPRTSSPLDYAIMHLNDVHCHWDDVWTREAIAHWVDSVLGAAET